MAVMINRIGKQSIKLNQPSNMSIRNLFAENVPIMLYPRKIPEIYLLCTVWLTSPSSDIFLYSSICSHLHN